MSEAAIQEIELDIESAQEFVSRKDALDRLYANEDFKSIIVEGYFKEEAIRNVGIKNHPNFQDEISQAGILKAIDGIGALQGYFSVIDFQAAEASDAISAHRAELEYIESGEEE